MPWVEPEVIAIRLGRLGPASAATFVASPHFAASASVYGVAGEPTALSPSMTIHTTCSHAAGAALTPQGLPGHGVSRVGRGAEAGGAPPTAGGEGDAAGAGGAAAASRSITRRGARARASRPASVTRPRELSASVTRRRPATRRVTSIDAQRLLRSAPERTARPVRPRRRTVTPAREPRTT